MMKRKLLFAASLAALLSSGVLAQSAGALPPITDDAPIYGSQMMTPQERIEHRNRMRAAKTPEEREQIRAEQHEQMQARAKERGMTLPDDPPRSGMGGGMGPGGRQSGGPSR